MSDFLDDDRLRAVQRGEAFPITPKEVWAAERIISPRNTPECFEDWLCKLRRPRSPIVIASQTPPIPKSSEPEAPAPRKDHVSSLWPLYPHGSAEYEAYRASVDFKPSSHDQPTQKSAQ